MSTTILEMDQMRALLRYPKGKERSNISTPIKRLKLEKFVDIVLEGTEKDLEKIAELVRKFGGVLYLDAKLDYEKKITKC